MQRARRRVVLDGHVDLHAQPVGMACLDRRTGSERARGERRLLPRAEGTRHSAAVKAAAGRGRHDLAVAVPFDGDESESAAGGERLALSRRSLRRSVGCRRLGQRPSDRARLRRLRVPLRLLSRGFLRCCRLLRFCCSCLEPPPLLGCSSLERKRALPLEALF